MVGVSTSCSSSEELLKTHQAQGHQQFAPVQQPHKAQSFSTEKVSAKNNRVQVQWVQSKGELPAYEHLVQAC